MKKGLFVTFEGIEGSGKTTQIQMLDQRLREKGFQTVLTREPGGTKISDQIRAILLSPENKAMVPITELLLYAAARAQHVAEVVLPAVASGKIVLCDRYADATTAYQGAARKINTDYLAALHEMATNNLKPDLTLLLDMDSEAGLQRAKKRNIDENLTNKEDRFEQEALDFHRRVREGYLAIAKREPERFCIIDATAKIDEMQKNILTAVERLIKVN